MESEVKVVARHEKLPPEQEQSRDAGLPVVKDTFNSSSSGEHVPEKVTVSPDEKYPGSFKLTSGVADETTTWLSSPASFCAVIVNVGVGMEVSDVEGQLKEPDEQVQFVICEGLALANLIVTVDPFGSHVPANVYEPPW